MDRLKLRHIAMLGSALLAATSAAHANESTAELSIGGLKFAQSDDIVMESEDLRISLDRVNVRYQFANTSAKPVTLTVAFPLPDIDLSDADNIALPSSNPANFVDFETKVDGVPAHFLIDQRAMVGGRDMSAVLHQFNLPQLPIGPREIRIGDLPEATRTQLADQGLLMPVRTDEKGQQQYALAWITKTTAVRPPLTFPPDRKVLVEHQYKPVVGTSLDSILRSGLRRSQALSAEVQRYRKDYCISDAFLAELDKRTGNAPLNTAMIQERRISYVLKTGANWAGPIRSFKLSIDPGSDRLVSFCHGRLKPTAPDALEFTATDFKPDSDLKILIIGRF